MWNKKQIFSLGLGLSLLFAQTAQAAYIVPLESGGEGHCEIHGAMVEFSQAGPGSEEEESAAQGSGQGSFVSQEQPGQGAASQTEPGQGTVTQTEPGQGTGTQGQTAGNVSQEGPGESGQSMGTQEQPPLNGGLLEPGQPGAQENGGTAGAGLVSQGVYSTKEAVGQPVQTGTAQTIAEPVVSAEAAILYDVTHNRFLYEKNADEKLYPASITKLMTALLVLENAGLDETVTFSKEAVTNLESGAVTLKVAEGDQISVKDCLYGLLLKSANEVANGLAEHVSGSVSKFAELMNEKARALGCTNTNFVNPNGLNDPNHYTTCRDMARIAASAFANPTLCQISSTMSYQFPATKNVSQPRTLTPGHKMLYPNDSRYYEGIVGGKTGYTSLAGNTLVTCTERDGVRMIAVVMKAQSTHYADTKAVLDYGYALNSAGALGNASYHRWIQDGTVWRFELADGTRLQNGRYTIDGADYAFDSEGRMLTGWQNLNGVWYCFQGNGAMVKNGWMQDQDKWFYLGSDGAMVKNAVIDGQYYVGADGIWIP